ncbi:MAG TPA: hypothetical protein PLZ78_08930 [Spirochaetota bacterium]|nr:hypothetical protein [Spirochaetota bacterium]
MKTHRDTTFPDPEEIDNIDTLRDFAKKLIQILEEYHIDIYEDIKALQRNIDITLSDGVDIAVGTTTGTKIGTATTQLLGFFNKTPVDQPAAVADATGAGDVVAQLNALIARMRELGLIAT